MTHKITPRYKLLLFYDLNTGRTTEYLDFVMNEFIPAAHEMNLYIFRVFHTAWGECPSRQTEFVAESLEAIHTAVESERWQALEARLCEHASNYQRKIVRFRKGFQF